LNPPLRNDGELIEVTVSDTVEELQGFLQEALQSMIRVSESITLSEDEIEENFIRSSGPGGQHVNKTSTGVQLRFDVANSPSLSEEVRFRLSEIAASRLTNEGILVITATNKRSQSANRKEALDRLVTLIRTAEKRPKNRRKTRPSHGAKARRMDNKQRRSNIKRSRSPVQGNDE
jgi:ribosome-associated protein